MNEAQTIWTKRKLLEMDVYIENKGLLKMTDALFETVILAIAGVVMVYMVGTMVDNAINIVFYTLPGQIILAGLLLIILMEIMKLMKQSR